MTSPKKRYSGTFKRMEADRMVRRFNFLMGRLFKNQSDGIFRQIPLKIPGKLFTSPMPSGAYDRHNRLLKIYQKHSIDHVFILVTDEELKKKARKDIFQEYEKRGITWSRYVMEDFQAPSLETIKELVSDAVYRLCNKEHILVHCHAGVGRTSVAVACIAISVEGMTAHEAIDHIKANMMVNITSGQKLVVQDYEKHTGEFQKADGISQ